MMKRKTYLRRLLSGVACLAFLVVLNACSEGDDNGPLLVDEGVYTREWIQTQAGFEEERDDILDRTSVSDSLFVALSTDSAWALSGEKQQVLLAVRQLVSKPSAQTLLQKIIPLEDISTYMNNVYGGTVGGFVCEAADVKRLYNMHDVYWGLRLDYEGTKFRPDGAGYAVIRFYSAVADQLQIPLSPELGGSQPHAWPNGGGGFTTSTLGKGGYPEWTFKGYYAPEEGAELYEVTPAGREILRSVYTGGKWCTYESDFYPIPSVHKIKLVRNGVFGGRAVQTLADYAGQTFTVRGIVDGAYHLVTTKPDLVPDLNVVEKGVYGIVAGTLEVTNIRETEVW